MWRCLARSPRNPEVARGWLRASILAHQPGIRTWRRCGSMHRGRSAGVRGGDFSQEKRGRSRSRRPRPTPQPVVTDFQKELRYTPFSREESSDTVSPKGALPSKWPSLLPPLQMSLLLFPTPPLPPPVPDAALLKLDAPSNDPSP